MCCELLRVDFSLKFFHQLSQYPVHNLVYFLRVWWTFSSRTLYPVWSIRDVSTWSSASHAWDSSFLFIHIHRASSLFIPWFHIPGDTYYTLLIFFLFTGSDFAVMLLLLCSLDLLSHEFLVFVILSWWAQLIPLFFEESESPWHCGLESSVRVERHKLVWLMIRRCARVGQIDFLFHLIVFLSLVVNGVPRWSYSVPITLSMYILCLIWSSNALRYVRWLLCFISCISISGLF